MQLDGDADHAQEIVQEVFSDRVRWAVAGKADGRPELTHKGLELIERIPGDTGEERIPFRARRDFVPADAGRRSLPRTFTWRCFAEEESVVEQCHLAGLAEDSKPELFGIAVNVSDIEGIDPAAPVAPGGNLVEVAHDGVAFVLLKVLIGLDGIAGLGAGIDSIKNLRLLSEIITVALEVLIPVGKLDHDLELGIDGLGGTHDEVARDFVHGLEAEVGPTLVALGSDVGGLLGVGEEEVVENDFVKESGGHLRDMLHVSPVFGLGVSEGGELAIVVVGKTDGAGDLDALRGEELLDLTHERFVG